MLIIAATPIGNLGDVSARLRTALETVPVIACEDTRVAGKLLHALGIEQKPKLLQLHDHNEKQNAAALAELAAAQDVLLISDAGTPLVSDPGYQVVQQAIAAGTPITVIPGPSAPIAALTLSGLPSSRFSFEGFLPRKAGEQRRLLTELARHKQTLIFFESPERLNASLEVMAEVLGAERQAAVVREITKLYEEVVRGTLGELTAAEHSWRGEIVLVVAGAEAEQVDLESAARQVFTLVEQGGGLKQSSAEVAEATGLSARELYNRALQLRSL